MFTGSDLALIAKTTLGIETDVFKKAYVNA
jgi:hypothetical protein